MLFGVFSSSATLYQFGVFLLWSTIGNIVGGVVFVAILKHSHVQRGGFEPDEISVGEHESPDSQDDDGYRNPENTQN